jgi:hypothetical protein
MPPHPGPALRKVTLNLYEEDCAALEAGFGQGWTTQVREMVHDKSWSYRKHMPKTLGELDD